MDRVSSDVGMKSTDDDFEGMDVINLRTSSTETLATDSNDSPRYVNGIGKCNEIWASEGCCNNWFFLWTNFITKINSNIIPSRVVSVHPWIARAPSWWSGAPPWRFSISPCSPWRTTAEIENNPAWKRWSVYWHVDRLGDRRIDRHPTSKPSTAAPASDDVVSPPQPRLRAIWWLPLVVVEIAFVGERPRPMLWSPRPRSAWQMTRHRRLVTNTEWNDKVWIRTIGSVDVLNRSIRKRDRVIRTAWLDDALQKGYAACMYKPGPLIDTLEWRHGIWFYYIATILMLSGMKYWRLYKILIILKLMTRQPSPIMKSNLRRCRACTWL